MHVVMLTSSFPAFADDYRGRFVWDMARDWASKGDHVTVVTPHPGHGAPLRETLGGVMVERIPIPAWDRGAPTLFGGAGTSTELRKRPWLAASIPWQLWGLARAVVAHRGHMDLLVSHWVFPMGVLGAWAASRLGVPHGIVEHGGGVRALQRFAPFRPLAREAVARACGVQWVAQHQLGWAQKHRMGNRGFVFPMPLPKEYQAPTALRTYQRPPRVLWAGRMISAKGGEDLLKAMALVPELSVTLAGDGPSRARWESMAHTLAPGRLDFLGEVPASEMRPLMDRHDALVFTSRPQGNKQEGTPRVLLEAMSRGLIPVAARTGGVVDFVTQGHTGLLFRPGDIQGLAGHLRFLASHPDQATALSNAARSRVSEVDFDTLRQVWLEHLPR